MFECVFCVICTIPNTCYLKVNNYVQMCTIDCKCTLLCAYLFMCSYFCVLIYVACMSIYCKFFKTSSGLLFPYCYRTLGIYSRGGGVLLQEGILFFVIQFATNFQVEILLNSN